MQKAVAKEGPRAPLFCLGLALLIAASGTAAARPAEKSDLELCASLATPELKLACFEALTAVQGSGAEPAAETTPKVLPETAAAESASKIATSAGVTGSGTGHVASAPAAAAANEPAVDVADEPGREHRGEAQAAPVDEFGKEYLPEEQAAGKGKAVVRVTVSEVVKGSYDILYFHFTNGQVWRQFEARQFSYPRDGAFDVTINQGMMGDYRLRLDAGGPMTRIRRVK